jgi:hypothetical protein
MTVRGAMHAEGLPIAYDFADDLSRRYVEEAVQ